MNGERGRKAPLSCIGESCNASGTARSPTGAASRCTWSDYASRPVAINHPARHRSRSLAAGRSPPATHRRSDAAALTSHRLRLVRRKDEHDVRPFLATHCRDRSSRRATCSMPRHASLADRCSLTLHLVRLRIACRWAMRLAIRLRPDSAMTPRPCPARSHWLPRLRSLPAATPCRTGAGEGCCCCETQYGVAGCSPSRISGPPNFLFEKIGSPAARCAAAAPSLTGSNHRLRQTKRRLRPRGSTWCRFVNYSVIWRTP